MIFNLRTGKKSPVASTEQAYGFWLSQDIVIAENTSTHKIQTLDLKTQKWTDFAPGILDEDVLFGNLSPDGKYLYYKTRGAEPKAMRFRLADQRVEPVINLKDLHLVAGAEFSVASDGSPIFARDTGYQEIYALNVRWP